MVQNKVLEGFSGAFRTLDKTIILSIPFYENLIYINTALLKRE